VDLVVIGFVDDHNEGLKALQCHGCVFTDDIVLVDHYLDGLDDGVKIGFIKDWQN
jgi:hypothetical protein